MHRIYRMIANRLIGILQPCGGFSPLKDANATLANADSISPNPVNPCFSRLRCLSSGLQEIPNHVIQNAAVLEVFYLNGGIDSDAHFR